MRVFHFEDDKVSKYTYYDKVYQVLICIFYQ